MANATRTAVRSNLKTARYRVNRSGFNYETNTPAYIQIQQFRKGCFGNRLWDYYYYYYYYYYQRKWL